MSGVKTALYRHWDADGNLLYVGISLSAVHRLTQHMQGAGWAGDIASMTVESFPSRDGALVAEKAAIKAEKPKWNKVHNRPVRAANDNRTPTKRNKPAKQWANPDDKRLAEAMKVASKLFYTWVDDEQGLGFSELEELYRYAPELAHWRRGGVINPAPSRIIHELLETQVGWYADDDSRIRAVM